MIISSNMSGVCSGVQARFRKINSLAVVTCSAQSINWSAAESYSAVVNYFGVVQSVYTLFLASPQRWSTYKERLRGKANTSVIKSLLKRRWSARNDASKAFYANYLGIRLLV